MLAHLQSPNTLFTRFLRPMVSTSLALSIFSTGGAAMADNLVIDNARLLTPSTLQSTVEQLKEIEDTTQWHVRVLTTVQPVQSASQLKVLWNTDDKTIIVVEDLTSPNILSFSTGSTVSQQLPRQFFLELQSRYGNQFFVRQEGETQALLSSIQVLKECLQKPGGCKNVPGLTDDLYYLTLATSIAGGCVFGFAARVPAREPWQWILVFSPLWFILFGSFGILPVIQRTAELEPLVKNSVGFFVGAAAIYLTPILGPPPGKV